MRKLPDLLLFFVALLLIQMPVYASEKIIEVPMKFRGVMPAVEVFVNGEGPFLFAIDTGGQGQARADSSLVEKLKLKKIDEVLAGDGSGRNTQTLDIVGFDTLKIGDLEFKDVRALTRDYNRSPRVPKIDGILGFNLFEDYLLTLDYTNKKVIIENGALPESNGKDILDFADDSDIPSIYLNVGGQKIKAHIDTGNMVGGFVLPTELIEKIPHVGKPSVVGQARTISNTIEIKQVQLKDTIKFGEFEFSEPRVIFPALRDANVGSPLWQEFSLTFDQKNRRVRLKRTELKKEAPTTKISKFKDYVGKYESRTISEKDGELYIQREGGPELKLKEIEKDEYSLEIAPKAKIKFVRDDAGKVTEIKVLNPRGEWEISKKDK